MAKKKNLKMFIPGAIACVFGIAAFCMMFLNAVQMSVSIGGATWESGDTFTGAQLAFGYKTEGLLGGETTVLNFNIMIFLGFALPLIGGVLALLFKNGFLTKIITTACFVVGAVFLFSTTGFTAISLGEEAKDGILLLYKEELAVGPIIAGILAIIGAAVCFFKGTIAKALSR